MRGSRGVIVILAALEVAVACGGRASNREDATNAGSAQGGHTAAGEPSVRGGTASIAGSPQFTGGAGAGARAGAGAGAGASGDAGFGDEPSTAGAGGAGTAGASAGAGGDAGSGGAGPRAPGDINGDGCVDLEDYSILARCYNYRIDHCAVPEADVQGDGWVGFEDYLILINHWRTGPRCRTFCEARDDSGGAAGALNYGSPDLTGDQCVNFDDLDRLAQSYGCGPECAAPGTDLIPDGCVDDQDRVFLTASFDTAGPCVQHP